MKAAHSCYNILSEYSCYVILFWFCRCNLSFRGIKLLLYYKLFIFVALVRTVKDSALSPSFSGKLPIPNSAYLLAGCCLSTVVRFIFSYRKAKKKNLGMCTNFCSRLYIVFVLFCRITLFFGLLLWFRDFICFSAPLCE